MTDVKGVEAWYFLSEDSTRRQWNDSTQRPQTAA